ncbi:helix-turn-helix domain-containing protein [Methylobacterium organophilum]|nr:AraC family transcriptional regulator [Methylobacterium organophilum]
MPAMKVHYNDYGCRVDLDGDVDAVLGNSAEQGWCGIGFTDVVLGPRGRVALTQQGVQFGLSLSPGRQTFTCAGESHHFQGDNIAVLEPGSEVVGAWEGSFRNLTLKLAPEAVERLSHEPVQKLGVRTQFLPSEARSAVAHLLLAVSADLQAGCPGGPVLVESIATALLRMFSERAAPVPRAAPRLHSTKAAELRALIGAHLTQPLGLPQLADAAGMSVGHLVRAFKASFGLTPHQYILRERVYRARDLIEAGAPSLRAVASQAGFTDASQMAKTFRRVLGVTPREVARAARVSAAFDAGI